MTVEQSGDEVMAEADPTRTESCTRTKLGSHFSADVTALQRVLVEKVLGHPLSESKISSQMLKCLAGIAQVRYMGKPAEEEVDLTDDKQYDPSSKGDATWKDGGQLETADGWIITTGPVKQHFYASVKGIDLVRWFVDCYFNEQAASKKLVAEMKKKKKEQDANPLGIPNPRLPRKNARNRKSKKKPIHFKGRRETFPFLDLPIEIRRLVYSFAVGDGRALIHGSHPNKEYNVAKAAWKPEGEVVKRPRYRLGHLLDNDDIHGHVDISPASMLVSKQVHIEAEPIVYSQLTFCFDSTKVLHKFLNSASKEGIKNIKRLELYHNGYAKPRASADRRFKTIHDIRWRQACERVGADLPSLSWLKVDLTLRSTPVNLHSNARWRKTLLRLVPHGPLQHVEVMLSHHRTRGHALQTAARRLEDAMMTPQGRRVRDDIEIDLAVQRITEVEAARREHLRSLPPVQATNVLTVRVNGTDRASEEADKEYYTSKTEGFAKKLLYGEHWN